MPYKTKEDKQAYHKSYHAEWYKRNKESIKQKQKQNRQDKKTWWREYKSSLSCSQCGASHPGILDFHHRDGLDKDETVTNLVSHNRSKEAILAEVAKCDVLCANCHRIIHYEMRGQHLDKSHLE